MINVYPGLATVSVNGSTCSVGGGGVGKGGLFASFLHAANNKSDDIIITNCFLFVKNLHNKNYNFKKVFLQIILWKPRRYRRGFVP